MKIAHGDKVNCYLEKFIHKQSGKVTNRSISYQIKV